MMKKKVESFGVVDDLVVFPMEMKEEEDEGRSWSSCGDGGCGGDEGGDGG